MIDKNKDLDQEKKIKKDHNQINKFNLKKKIKI